MTLIGYLIIPIFTLFYASQASFTQENFTGIANQQGLAWLLVLWTILVVNYFTFCSQKLFSIYHWRPAYLKCTQFLIYICSLMAPLIPYQLERYHLASLHILLAAIPTVLFLMLIRLFLAHIQWIEPKLYQTMMPRFHYIIITVIFLILSFGHINSLIEAFLACSLSIFLTYSLK